MIGNMINKAVKIFKHNPVSFHTEQVFAVEEAYKRINNHFEELAKRGQWSNEEIEEAKKLLETVYLERKANYFITYKLDSFSRHLDHVCMSALSSPFEERNKEQPASLLYCNYKHHMVSNEQY